MFISKSTPLDLRIGVRHGIKAKQPFHRRRRTGDNLLRNDFLLILLRLHKSTTKETEQADASAIGVVRG